MLSMSVKITSNGRETNTIFVVLATRHVYKADATCDAAKTYILDSKTKDPTQMRRIAANVAWRAVIQKEIELQNKIAQIPIEEDIKVDIRAMKSNLLKADLSKALPIVRGFWCQGLFEILGPIPEVWDIIEKLGMRWLFIWKEQIAGVLLQLACLNKISDTFGLIAEMAVSTREDVMEALLQIQSD